MVASHSAMAGEQTRAAVLAQPDWLREVPERVGARRFPSGRLLLTGCGTSYHAAQVGAQLAGGEAVQALELVLAPRDADLLVVVSHEGETTLTVEAARAFPGPVWLVTGKPESTLGRMAAEVVVASKAVEDSWCHTASYTAAVAAMAALAGHDVSWLPEQVEAALARPLAGSEHERFVVAGAGRDWPTAQEAVLKLREGAFAAAEAYETEQLMHGYLAAVDETVRAFVLEGEGRAADRSADLAAALRELGAPVELLPQSPDPAARPILGIIPFHLLVLELAAARGRNPDRIRRDDERWARAAAATKEPGA